MNTQGKPIADFVIRPMQEADLAAADQVMRLAFGTLIGLPDPSAMFGDAGYVMHRWRANSGAAYVAEQDGELIGSSFATRWGSFGTLGPLTVRPDCWGTGVGSKLVEPIMDLFAQWRIRLAGLYTSPQSPMHVGLYQKFGFRPRYLTAVMARPVDSGRPTLNWGRFSQVPPDEQIASLYACRNLSTLLYQGLDLAGEIYAVDAQGLGDTILLWDGSELVGFAVCHQGAMTEAGSGVCYVKFAAVLPDKRADRHFDELLQACESYAATRGASRLVAGVNTARQEAYQAMLQLNFRTQILGVAMHSPNQPGFSRSGIYVLDDWR